MKVVKPQRLGVLSRVYEHKNECFFVVTLMAYFPFDPPWALLPEVKLWKLTAAELGKEAALDMCMPKPKAELLVTGRACALGGTPRTAVSARVKIGNVDKTLYVIGDRSWTLGVASDPEPFTEMPISWQKSFGGEGYAQNPLGKGYGKVKTEKGDGHPLPNVEDPARLIRSQNDRPPPAGFGAYDMMWPQRYSKVGTYDSKWLKDQSPGLADDTDFTMFNTAPEDQHFEAYLRGDEAFRIEHMHPDKPVLESTLPGVKARCFITQRTPEGEVFREIGTAIDTVHLFPHVERGIVIFRGITRIEEDDADDVIHLVAACEDMAEPKPFEHYKKVLEERLDKTRGPWLTLRDRDLMPARRETDKRPDEDQTSDMDELVATEGLLQKNMRRRMELELEEAREKVKALGLDPDEHVPRELPPPMVAPDPDELADVVEEAMGVAERAKVESEAKKAEAEKDARAACARAGLDFEQVMRDARKGAGGPPTFSAHEEMEKLRRLREVGEQTGPLAPDVEATLSDPDLERKLVAAERQLRETYRRFAHHFPPAASLEGDDAARVREVVVVGHRAGESFADRDLTGANLSGLDLSGIDLRGAFLECADLSGATLDGANLEGAVLARADLTGASLAGASMAGVNLGQANLTGAQVTGGVDLTGSTLGGADLSGASFRGARMASADLFEAKFADTDLGEVTAPGINFYQSDLSGLKVPGADLSKCNFLEVSVAGVDFSGATLTSAVFVTARGDGADFRNAKLGNLRVVKDSSFAGADFRGASLEGANLRGTNLAGCDLSGANLEGADLSGCDLREAKLYRAKAKGALLIRADLRGATLLSIDLMSGILQKAKLQGADLRGANLFRADLAKIEGDKETQLDEANLTQVRVVPRRTHAKG